MNINKAIIVGRLTRDPEVRTTPNGQTVVNFSLATTYSWKDQSGQKQERPEYHNIVAWGKRGEVIGQYCTKGQELYIEGRLETRNWDDKESGKKMYRTEIIMENFEFGAKAGAGGSGGGGYQAAAAAPAAAASAPAPAAPAPEIEDEDIPTINLEEEEKVKIEDVPF